MNKQFNPKIRQEKIKTSINLDKDLNDLMLEVMKEHNLNYADTLHEVIIFFKEEYWDNRNQEKEEKATPC